MCLAVQVKNKSPHHHHHHLSLLLSIQRRDIRLLIFLNLRIWNTKNIQIISRISIANHRTLFLHFAMIFVQSTLQTLTTTTSIASKAIFRHNVKCMRFCVRWIAPTYVACLGKRAIFLLAYKTTQHLCQALNAV
jgi:hypothetical protein